MLCQAQVFMWSGDPYTRICTDMYTLYQEQAVFGKMKMDPAKQAQTQITGEVSSLELNSMLEVEFYWEFSGPQSV
jgi:hypothetical protein